MLAHYCTGAFLAGAVLFYATAALAQNIVLGSSRLPSGIAGAPVADDSDAARQTALGRLRLRQGKPVCSGTDSRVPSHLGTPCGTREFDAPALLEAPKVQWKVNKGYWTFNPFVVVGDRLFSASCRHNTEADGGTYALDAKTGKLLWRDRKICEKTMDPDRYDDSEYRLFALPDQSLLVSVVGVDSGYRQFRYDMKAGKLLSQGKKRLNWWNMQLAGSQFISHAHVKSGAIYIAARSPDLGEPVWKREDFAGLCPRELSPDSCMSYNVSNFAWSDGVIYASAARLDMAPPVHRQLHAIDLKTGALLWRHTSQGVEKLTERGPKRADDGSPMVTQGKVILRVDDANASAFRALDAKGGTALWTTQPMPIRFKEEWLPRGKGRRADLAQEVQSHLIADGQLIVLMQGDAPGHCELWAYRVADGQASWRRPCVMDTPHIHLAAAAGGAVYFIDHVGLNALEAQSGTLLWTLPLSSDTDNPDSIGMPGGHPSERTAQRFGEISWPDTWVIGPDGGFYVASPYNLSKLR
jgi:outer membrane protein assembly factor BamB